MNPLHSPKLWRRKAANAEKLYGAIVAQARLPKFYQDFAVPDTMEGRFLILSLHLFAVLRRLKAEGEAGVSLAQTLTDRFMQDMETVLREMGVGDFAIPKRVRALAGQVRASCEATRRLWRRESPPLPTPSPQPFL